MFNTIVFIGLLICPYVKTKYSKSSVIWQWLHYVPFTCKKNWPDQGIQLTAEHDNQVCKYGQVTLMKNTGVRGLVLAFVFPTAGMTPDREQRPAMAAE